MPVHDFKVDMTCKGCSGAVERVLSKLKGQGVDKIDISLENQKVTVTTTLPADEILQLIKKTGKNVTHLSSQ